MYSGFSLQVELKDIIDIELRRGTIDRIVQEVQASLESVLQMVIINITNISVEEAYPLPPAPYFHTELTLAELEPISTNRYAARFRFRIYYMTVEGKPVATIMDEMLEELTLLDVGGRLCPRILTLSINNQENLWATAIGSMIRIRSDVQPKRFIPL